MKNLKLVRYGGLSAVKQKHYSTNYDEMEFHGAPERFGFYSFLFPYIDWFLLSGDTGKIKNVDSSLVKNRRATLAVPYKKFSVNGFIWTHIKPTSKNIKMITDTRGSWYKIHSSDFNILFKKEFSLMVAENNRMFGNVNKTIKNPYSNICTDYLEIFVPKNTTILPFGSST